MTLKVRQKSSCFHTRITNLAPYITSFIFCVLCVCNNSMHVWSDRVKQLYHRLQFWHTFKFASNYLVIQVKEQYGRDESAWIQEFTVMFYICCSKRGWVCQRCMPIAANPIWISQHGLGCQECHWLDNYFIFSHMREKHVTFKNWTQSDPGCCQYSHVKLQHQESEIIIVVSAAECACHKKSVCDN